MSKQFTQSLKDELERLTREYNDASDAIRTLLRTYAGKKDAATEAKMVVPRKPATSRKPKKAGRKPKIAKEPKPAKVKKEKKPRGPRGPYKKKDSQEVEAKPLKVYMRTTERNGIPIEEEFSPIPAFEQDNEDAIKEHLLSENGILNHPVLELPVHETIKERSERMLREDVERKLAEREEYEFRHGKPDTEVITGDSMREIYGNGKKPGSNYVKKKKL